jgi:uncharacterized protein (TIRG00374 family)
LKPKKYRKYVEFGALCILAIGLFWFFGRSLDWNEVRSAISRSNPYLLAAAALIISLAYFLRACRWGALLKPLVRARLADLFAATTVGFTAVLLIGRTGEVVRPVVLPMRDPKVRPSAALVTIMVERIYDTMAILLMFAINLIWFRPTSGSVKDFEKVRLAGIVLVVVALFGVAFLTWFRKNSTFVIGTLQRVFARWTFMPQRLTKLVIGTLEQLARALRVLVNARELAETIGWTALTWFSILLANVLVIRAFGIPFGFPETIFVLGWSMAGSVVPTPGGAAGAFHAATAAGLLFLGIPKAEAAGVSIVMHLIDFGPAAVFGFLYVIRGDLSISRLRAMMSPENVEHVVEDEPLETDDSRQETRSFKSVSEEL